METPPMMELQCLQLPSSTRGRPTRSTPVHQENRTALIGGGRFFSLVLKTRDPPKAKGFDAGKIRLHAN
jgi:hypothetical protein